MNLPNKTLPPLIFVYLGNALPDYAKSNLTRMATSLPNRIILISDQETPDVPKNVEIVVTNSSWYNKQRFSAFARRSSVDSLFRGGFWLRAIERLFVIGDYCQAHDIESFIHGELDVLLFDVNALPSALDRLGKGIFLPPEDEARALASLIYVNNLRSWDFLLRYFENVPGIGNEMKILGKFMRDHPEHTFAIPSDRIFDSRWPFGFDTLSKPFGLVDTSGIGQWLFGPDPRNTPGSTFTRYKSRGLQYPISSLRFKWKKTELSPHVIGPNGERYPLVAIHVHSKIFSVLKSRAHIKLFLHLNNLGVRIPIRLSTAEAWAKATRAFLRRKRGPAFELLLQTSIGKKAIETCIDRSKIVLSERQQAQLHRIFVLPERKILKRTELILQPKLKNKTVNVYLINEYSFLGADERQKAEQQIELLQQILDWDQPVFVNLNDFASFSEATSVRKHKYPLFIARNKNFEHTKHAVSAWWGQNVSRSWAFSNFTQLIEPRWLQEMFPAGRPDILRWADAGLNSRYRKLSALASYASWARASHRNETFLVANSREELAPGSSTEGSRRS